MSFTVSSELLQLWRRDPIAFANDVLPDDLLPWQENALDAYARENWTATAATRRAGKSRFEAISGLHWLATRFESLTFTVAPTWAQVSDAVWTEIRYLWAHSKLPRMFPRWEILTTSIKTTEARWRAVGAASNDVQNLEGRHAGIGGALVIIDEAKGVSDEFFESCLNMLGSADAPGKLIVAGTPGIPRGFFYRAFTSERHLWGSVTRVSALDIPALRARAEAARERLGEDNPFYRQQQLAEFCMAEGNVVIPLNYVEAAVNRSLTAHHNWRRVTSLDPAGTGADDSVLTNVEGPIVRNVMAWNGWDETRTATYAWDQACAFGADFIIIDEPGIGLSICYLIETLAKNHNAKTGDHIQVVRYKPGKRARDRERFQNRKSEDIFALADRFREGDISIPNHPMLIGQLVSYTWASTAGSKTEVIDPPDSPDYADSMQMAFALDNAAQHVRTLNARGLN